MPIAGSLDMSPAERKAAERRHDELEQGRLVVFSRRNGRRSFWKLSSDTDWRLRSLVGLYGFEEMLVAMLALQAHEAEKHDPTDNIVPEIWLAGLDAWGAPQGNGTLAALQFMFAPALCRNLVRAWSDCEGRAIYRLTSSGRAFLHSPTAPPQDLPDYDGELADLFDAATRSARDELANAEPNQEKMPVAIPLSAGTWPEDKQRAAIPFVLGPDGDPLPLPVMLAAIEKANKVQPPKRQPKRPARPSKPEGKRA
jgi:hypothetical protein